MKEIAFHSSAAEFVRDRSADTRRELGETLTKLQLGLNLGLPLSRPMPLVMLGVHEIRLRDESGIYRVFYYTKSAGRILVFHAFTKKTQHTPEAEIKVGRKRLKDMLRNG